MSTVTLADISRIAQSKYWKNETSNFRNTFHSATIAVWTHYANMFFGGDYSRIVYASTDFAFRKRVRQTGSQQLDLPFMNLHLKSIKQSVSRKWWHHIASIRGIYIDELKRNVKFIPVTLEYDAVIFVHKDVDMHYAISKLFFDENNETILKPTFEIEGHTLDSIGIVGYSLNPLEKYNENEFLKENKIIANRLDVSLETFLIQDDSNVSIPSKVILDFASKIKPDFDSNASEQDIMEGILGEEDGQETTIWTNSKEP